MGPLVKASFLFWGTLIPTYMGVSENRGTLFGGPYTTISGTILGSLILGNPHMIPKVGLYSP